MGEISIGFGSAGGLLLTGILVGYLRSLRATFGRVLAAKSTVPSLGYTRTDTFANVFLTFQAP